MTDIGDGLLWGGAVYLAVNCVVPFSYRKESLIYTAVIALAVICSWTWMRRATLDVCGRVVGSVGRCSMGIYVLHYWVLIYVLSNTSIRLFHLAELFNWYPLLTTACVAVAVFALSYMATHLLLKSRLTRWLIGG